MKKNSPLRLKLNRETLGSLSSSGMTAVQGGAVSTGSGCFPTLYVTCGCPPLPTHSMCPSCAQNCTVIC
jgi:hypothetical protein